MMEDAQFSSENGWGCFPVITLPSRRRILTDWLAAQPLVPVAGGMVLGIGMDAVCPLPWLLSAGLFLFAGLILIRFRDHAFAPHLAVLIAALAIGAVRHDLGFRRWSSDHIARYRGDSMAAVRMKGTVIIPPAIRHSNSGRICWLEDTPHTRMYIEAESVRGTLGDLGASGKVAITILEPVADINAGDRVELLGRMSFWSAPTNPGERDEALYNQRRGVLAHLTCKKAVHVRVIEHGDRFRRLIWDLRRRAVAAMLDRTYHEDEPGAQVLASLVLGQRSAVSNEINDAFAATGTVHYLSVSGSHVGLLMSMVWLVGLIGGFSRRWCALLSMVLVTGYTLLAEPQPPMLRAMVMGHLLCMAILLRRPVRSLNWLAAAALILLMIHPTELFDVGFQLSFVTVVGIMYVYPPLHRVVRHGMDKLLRRDDPLLQPRIQDMLNPPSKWRLFLRSAGAVLGAWILVSLAAWLSSLPLTAHHFHRLALWGWLSNVPVMPFVGIVEVLGLAKTAMAQVLPGTAALLGWPLAWATDGLLATVRFLARMPGAGMNIPAMPGWLVAAAMTLLGLWVVAPTMRIRHRVPALMAMGIAVVTTLWLCYPFHENACVIRVFSVGDGLATLVELPNGHVMVCDAGCRPPRDIEKRILGPFLARRAIRRIDTAVISHPNLDHYSALPDLTEHHSLKRFFTSPHFTLEGSKSGTAARLLDEMQTLSLRHHEVVKGDRLTGTGEVSIEVLWPPPCREMVIRESNNTSLVLRLTYAGKRILFCGDIEQMAQEHLLAMGDLKVDVMILPHHGSAKTTLPAFIAATNPEYCIRSSGQPDVESHPGLFRLMEGRRYFNTADDGAVEVRMTPAGLSVRPWLDRSNQRRGNQRMIMPAEPGPSEKFPLRPEIE